MVKRRNRKLETVIDNNLSNALTGVQYYETTLSNSMGYTDGFASSIWPMGTNVSFHNTGSSDGGDFGELNKLNYDNVIELYTPDTWVYGASGSYLSSSNFANIPGCNSTAAGMFPHSQVLKYTSAGAFGGTYQCITASLSASGQWGTSSFLMEGSGGYVEFIFSGSGDYAGIPSYVNRSLFVAMVPSGSNYGSGAYTAADQAFGVTGFPSYFFFWFVSG